MGTRSNTLIVEEGEQLVNMYRQMDGYLEGHGAELLAFLEPITMVDGINLHGDPSQANGGECLAAQMIAYFKKGVGNIYIDRPLLQQEDYVNDFTYTIIPHITGGIQVTVHEYQDQIFDGTIPQFKKFIEEAL